MLAAVAAALVAVATSTGAVSAAESAATVAKKGLADLASGKVFSTGPNGETDRKSVV